MDSNNQLLDLPLDQEEYEQLLRRKAADEREKIKLITHTSMEVLHSFKHHLRKLNRYRLSLVPQYVPPSKPLLSGLDKAA